MVWNFIFWVIFVFSVGSQVGAVIESEPKWGCTKFFEFTNDQFCEELCVDLRQNDLNVFAYLNDQTKWLDRGETNKEKLCYYAYGQKIHTSYLSED